ncbi:MAG TPA: chloride channel protein [Candidatus Limnocylindria bacterium]|jgi:CIC family chloride channel protein|nr:chloride channel protein [Candidatus Limnocylindria bacterium]
MKSAGERAGKTWLDASSQQWKAFLHDREEQVFLFLTLLIGAIVGMVVVAFILLTERSGARLYPAGGAAWRRLLVPVAGSALMGYLLYRFFPDARGSGVPQTKAALYARGGRISLGTVVGKFFCTSATLAGGIPLGREGPAVQVGAGIASVLGRRLGLRPEKVKALVPAGAAAAVAAAFNTPLAAVLFSLEEVVGDLHAPVLGSVVLASATSWAMLRLLLGNDPLFQVPQYQLVHPGEFGIYAMLGVAGGFVSVAFTKLLLWMRARFLRFPKKTLWFQPVAGGLTVGMMGWFMPQLLGVGYKQVGEALNGNMALKLMILLLVLKFFAVVASYASGNAGGIFGPSLFLGAMLGGIVGNVANHFLPNYVGTPGAYALVGMGTAFAGIVRAPMTSVVMIFEITRDYAVIVPLMISNLVSFFISARFQKQPIYEVLAHQDGIHLPTAETRQQGVQRQVVHAMCEVTEVLSAEMTVQEALEKSRSSKLRAWPVCEERGVIGVISLQKLKRLNNDGLGSSRLSEFAVADNFPHVHSDHPLHLALDRMGASQLDLLPVVSRANVHHLEGVVTLRDVLALYGVGPKQSE